MSNDWLPRVLEESRARGFLGPNAIEPHFTHSLGFALCWQELEASPPASFLDLGSGGGLPGLFLLDRWRCQAVFTDSMVKRAKFLAEVLEWDGAPDNGTVIEGRVEETARIPGLAEAFDLVTARSFGPPAVTAECAARFMKVGGVLIVSEPPDDFDPTRWNTEKLEELGLEARGRVRHGAAYQVLLKTHATPHEFPRGIGTPRKRPLF
ncbi:MAG: RsmG family class I SAM-dependent methyltransferase [Acidimicrobiales bacterium]